MEFDTIKPGYNHLWAIIEDDKETIRKETSDFFERR